MSKYSVYVQSSGSHSTHAVKGDLRAARANARDSVRGANYVITSEVYLTADPSATAIAKFTNRDSDGNVGRVREVAVERKRPSMRNGASGKPAARRSPAKSAPKRRVAKPASVWRVAGRQDAIADWDHGARGTVFRDSLPSHIRTTESWRLKGLTSTERAAAVREMTAGYAEAWAYRGGTVAAKEPKFPRKPAPKRAAAKKSSAKRRAKR